MPGGTGPGLDDEGVPDLEGPLADKEATGDPQEGVAPPGDRPRASVAWGVTAEEQREGEPVGVRTSHEEPEIDAEDPVDAVARGLGLDRTRVDETGTPYEEDDTFERIAGAEGDLRGHELVGDDLLDDEEGEEIASEVEGDPLGGQSAEEASMHVVDEE